MIDLCTLLRRSHELRVTLEKLAGKLKEADIERRELTHQIKNMEKDVNILQRSNEEAMVMRAIAVDERSKVSVEVVTDCTLSLYQRPHS